LIAPSLQPKSPVALPTNVDTRFFRLHLRVGFSSSCPLARAIFSWKNRPVEKSNSKTRCSFSLHRSLLLKCFFESSCLQVQSWRTIKTDARYRRGQDLRESLRVHSRRWMIDSGIRPRFKSDYPVDPIRRVRDPREEEGGRGGGRLGRRRRRRRDRVRDQLALKIRISM